MRARTAEKHVPERELPCVDALEVVWVFGKNELFKHADPLVSVNLDCEGILGFLAKDDAENGYRSGGGHCCVLEMGIVVLAEDVPVSAGVAAAVVV